MKLLVSAITFGKRFSTLTKIGQIATVGILIYLAFLFGTCTKPPTPDNDQSLTVTVEQTKQYAKELENTVKTLQDTVAQKETIITTLTIEISRRQKQQTVTRNQLVALETEARIERDTLLLRLPKTDTLIAQLNYALKQTDSITILKDSVITVREQQIELLKQSVNSAKIRGDTLQKTLDRVLEEHNRKNKLFGKIPLPSRKLVAATAFIGGVYVGANAVR